MGASVIGWIIKGLTLLRYVLMRMKTKPRSMREKASWMKKARLVLSRLAYSQSYIHKSHDIWMREKENKREREGERGGEGRECINLIGRKGVT